MSTTIADLQAMSSKELEADIKRLATEMRRCIDKADAENRELTPGEAERFDNLEAAIEARRVVMRDKVRARDAETTARVGDQPELRGYAAPNINYNRVADEVTDRGRQVIDENFRSGKLPAHAAEKATSLIETGYSGERSIAGKWATAAGDPAYRGAFVKLLADPHRGHLLWTPAEADAYRQVAAVQAEMEGRANMATTSTGVGAAMIPLTLDPAILLTNDGSNNPIRQLATVKQTMSNAWQGVTSAGATSEWKVQGAEAGDGAPTLASPSIPVFLSDSFVGYSYEIGQDGENFLEELARILADSLDNLHAVAFTTGNGTSAPQGIVTGLVGTASEINGQGAEAIAATDPFDLQNALPARFSANATWQAHIATMNVYRQFETTNGALQFPELRERPASLLGKPFYENSNMDGAINAAATENNYVMVYGDVAKGYYIVDRVGTQLELIPNLVDGSGSSRPTGERGAIMWSRHGAEVVVPQALRLLDIPSTA